MVKIYNNIDFFVYYYQHSRIHIIFIVLLSIFYIAFALGIIEMVSFCNMSLSASKVQKS